LTWWARRIEGGAAIEISVPPLPTRHMIPLEPESR
jgi:hypothetical protein